MAFGSITWDGRGVIANCDGLIDSVGGTWAELGGGGISYNTDTYLTGTGSIGHVYASKSGFGYYTTATNYDFTGAELGQFIYIWVNIASPSAFDLLANNGFSIVVGTNTSNYRTYKIAGSGLGESNGWSGGWKLFVVDPTIVGSIADVGTYSTATINMIGLWFDTIVSVRADTVFIDQVAIAKGLRAKDGSGTLDEIVDYCSNQLASRAWGVFQQREGIYYSYGQLTVGDNTTATSAAILDTSGNVVQYGISEFYHDVNGWSLTHPATYNNISLEKNASFVTSLTATNSSLFGATGANLGVTSEVGSSLTYSGGSFKYLPITTFKSGDTLTSVVISDSYAIKSNGSAMSGCTFVNTLEAATGALELLIASDLDTISNVVFNSFTGKYALYIPAGVTGTISLNNFTSDASGTDVYWAATSGTLTINKSNGTDFSTWAAGGTAIVNIVASVSININVKDQTATNILGALVYVDEDLEAAGEIINTTTDINGDVATSYSGAATTATVRIRKYGFKPYVGTISLTTDSSTNVTLITDPQQI